MRARVGRWLRTWADRIEPPPTVAEPRDAAPSSVEQHADPSLIEMETRGAASRRVARQFREAYARPDHMTYGQQSPKGTVRPPVITTQQVTPPPASVHHHCGHCDCG